MAGAPAVFNHNLAFGPVGDGPDYAAGPVLDHQAGSEGALGGEGARPVHVDWSGQNAVTHAADGTDEVAAGRRTSFYPA